MRKGCVAVFGTQDPHRGTERVIVLAETRETEADVLAQIRQRIEEAATPLLDAPPEEIVLGPPHAVPKTSSGKLRRTSARELFERGSSRFDRSLYGSDLDKEAEEHIVSWARELSVDKPIKIVIHLPDKEVHTKAAGELGEAFTGYFAYRADLSQHELNELFRVGRRSLSVGAMILVSCLVLAQLAAGYLTEAPLKRLVEESFLILGWVANWRPL